MDEFPRDFEIVWLKEIERRIADGLPIDSREMLVALRDKLPRGFKPSDVDRRLLSGAGPSVVGLKAIGDGAGLLPDIEKAMRYIRGRLIAYPSLAKVAAAEISEVLDFPIKRAERILALMSSLGHFYSSAAGSADGYSEIGLGRDDIVASYLAFTSLDELLATHSEPQQLIPAGGMTPQLSMETREVRRDTAFVLMNMDPQEDSLPDIYDAIKLTCSAYGIEARRIDEVEHQDTITERILEMIRTTDLIIADLSGEKPNVYYEVGYAHAVDKRPLLYRKKGTRLHFDLSVHKVSEYRNVTELKDMLHKRLEAILGRAARRNASA